MIKIYAQNKFLPEKKYIFDVLLTDFLGVDFEIKYHNKKTYILEFDNKIIEFSDCLFSLFDEKNTYLQKKSLPKKITFAENQFTVEKNIPIIYGNEKITISDNKISCGIDIFASSFFMLSRFEEYIIKEKDEHGRFPDTLATAQKYNFYSRPVVNEYVEILRNIFSFFGKRIKKKYQYSIKITHDIEITDEIIKAIEEQE